MNDQTQIITKINEAKNILITVGHNPSVDVLTAALGLTLAIDKMKKHSSAIFSGEIPPIMRFLHPERTFENSTESFQDFIILLDKEKADKLRYKVEGNLVKIFITPYHTTISPSDLKFEQGDLNVDLIIALGVKEQNDIDKAAMAHGKILHSATTITINTGAKSNFGTINSTVPELSSYSEAISKLIAEINEKLLSKQISTALLTGIVVETEQFSNVRTTPDTMTVASKLLSSGADQQLIIKEIRGISAPVKKPTVINEPMEIPKIETNTEPGISPESEPTPEPIAEEPIETLDDYLPPPISNLNDDLPPPPDINASEFSEVIQTKQPSNSFIEKLPRKKKQTKNKPSSNQAEVDSLPPPPDAMYKSEPATQQSQDQPKMVEITDTSKPDPTQFHIPIQ